MNFHASLAPVSSPTITVPDVLRATATRLAAELGENLVPLKARNGRPWIGLTTSYAVYIAYDAPTRTRIAVEAERLNWAAGCGLPVPEVVACESGWLVTVRAAKDNAPPDGSYSTAAVDAARRISAAPPPPRLHVDQRALVRARVGNWARVLRLGRMLGSIPYHEYRSLQRAVAGLRRDRLAHGDFHQENILFDRAQRSVTVVDWEHVGYWPDHNDLCRLWPMLASEVDREIILDAALTDTRDRAALGLLHHWFAVLQLVNHVTRPRSRRNAEGIARSKERVAESRANAKRWGAC